LLSFRGDAHKLYLKLKASEQVDNAFTHNKKLSEISDIQSFYVQLESSILKKIYYRMIKEKNGSGIIPIFVSAGPWLFLLFSNQIQQFLFKDGGFLWVIFVLSYLSILVISVTLHFYEKSWSAVHIEIIQDILTNRQDEKRKE
jgi:hypothetical protein